MPLKLDPSSEPAPVTDPEPVLAVSLEGICVDCGDRISAARLKALPAAERCVTCQRELESRER